VNGPGQPDHRAARLLAEERRRDPPASVPGAEPGRKQRAERGPAGWAAKVDPPEGQARRVVEHTRRTQFPLPGPARRAERGQQQRPLPGQGEGRHRGGEEDERAEPGQEQERQPGDEQHGQEQQQAAQVVDGLSFRSSLRVE
jgi:hypothetical protein